MNNRYQIIRWRGNLRILNIMKCNNKKYSHTYRMKISIERHRSKTRMMNIIMRISIQSLLQVKGKHFRF
jgi:hypothetical protein